MVHFTTNIFSIFCLRKLKKMQDCVSAFSKALNLHCTKAFCEGYVISKTKVKQNLLQVVIYFLKSAFGAISWELNKKRSKNQYDTILKSKSHLLSIQIFYLSFSVEFSSKNIKMF